MRVAIFDFDLPPERIASHPVSPRDAARMLRVTAGGLEDRHIRDLPEYLSPGDALVVNDTRVIPARLFGKRGEASIELLLHQPVLPGIPMPFALWSAFARPARRLRTGDVIAIAPDFALEVVGRRADGEVMLCFRGEAARFRDLLARHGVTPLPPYIPRPEGEETCDAADYQTCYARCEGSIAAPTAGLHFTPALLERVRARGADVIAVTLHVGGGTFLPVKADDTEEHRMHAEWGEITEEAAAAVNRAKARGGKIVAVGTTALRLLESAADPETGRARPWRGETDIFITPGYRFRLADRLLTNFHLPRSTLFMLTCAFSGLDHMRAAYRHAIATGYRFYSFGDACLLDRVDEPG